MESSWRRRISTREKTKVNETRRLVRRRPSKPLVLRLDHREEQTVDHPATSLVTEMMIVLLMMAGCSSVSSGRRSARIATRPQRIVAFVAEAIPQNRNVESPGAGRAARLHVARFDKLPAEVHAIIPAVECLPAQKDLSKFRKACAPFGDFLGPSVIRNLKIILALDEVAAMPVDEALQYVRRPADFFEVARSFAVLCQVECRTQSLLICGQPRFQCMNNNDNINGKPCVFELPSAQR